MRTDVEWEEIRNRILEFKIAGTKRKEICNILGIDFADYAKILRFKTEMEVLGHNLRRFWERTGNNITIQDVKDKFGENPTCQLSGESVSYRYCSFLGTCLEDLKIVSSFWVCQLATNSLEKLISRTINFLVFQGYEIGIAKEYLDQQEDHRDADEN